MPSAPVPQSPRLTLLHFTGALSALSLLAGCSGEPLPPPGAHAPPAAPERAGAGDAPVKQARWIAYARSMFEDEITRAPLGPTGCVITTSGGYRWATPLTGKLDEGDAASSTINWWRPDVLCGNRAEAAADRAPEDLVSILQQGEQAWLFVGESGTLYEAPGPLAPFRRTIAAPEPLCKVDGEGDVVLAVSCNGALLRYTEPSGWQKVASTPPAVNLFKVAVSGDGRAIALALPEALFTSGDRGVTWTPARLPPFGVRDIWRSKRAGSFVAEGLLDAFEWSDKAPITQAPTPWKRPQQTSQGRPTVVPSIWSLKEGIAVLDGDRYTEAVKPLNKGEPWRLAQGPFGGDLDLRPVPKSEDCASLHLGARGKHLFTLCLSGEGNDVPLLARQSVDLGETWSEPLDLIAQSSSTIGVAVAPDGSALITGVCKPAGKGIACQPTSPLLVRADGAKLRVTSASAPKLTGLALAPAYALEGRSAYFVGPRSGDKGMALFVSHDGGATFSARSLEGTAPRPTAAIGAHDKDEANEPESDAIVVGAVSYLRPGEDGSVGLLADITNGRRVYLTTDADGGALRAATPPMRRADVAGVGRHLIASSRYATEDEPGFWESTDGGTTWEAMPRLPVSKTHLERLDLDRIGCGTSGCIFGENLVRVGWGGAKAPDIPMLATESRSTTASSTLTPIVCELSPDTRWARIDHPVSTWTGRTPPLPGALEAMRGRSAWSMITANPATGAVSAVSATLPDSGGGEARVTTRPLLGPRPAGSRAAGRFIHTLEGYVTLRVPIQTDKEGKIKPGAKLRNVEVTWENYIAGTSGRGNIPDAGTLDEDMLNPAGDSTDGLRLPGQIDGDMYLRPKLVSLKVRGVAVSLSQEKLSQEKRPMIPVFLVNEQGRAERVTIPFPNDRSRVNPDAVSENVVQVGGKLLSAVIKADKSNSSLIFPGWYKDAYSILLGSRKEPAVAPSAGDSEWTWRALSLSSYPRSHVRVDGAWAYVGKETVGVTALMLNRRKGRDFASFSAIQADGTFAPPVPLATLSDLGDQPRPCTAAERESSPRFVALMFSQDGNTPNYPGLRHPVLVRELQGKGDASSSAPLTFLTGSAVTHGAPSSACVAAWEANGPPGSFARAIVSGDLTHSWMFRVIQATPTQVRHMGPVSVPFTPIAALEYRPMSCRFDPSARVPEAVSKEEGMGERMP